MLTDAWTFDLTAPLQAIVRRHGEAVLDDRARMLGLLRDYAPAAIPEIRAMMAVHDVGAVSRLRRAENPADAAVQAVELRSAVEASGGREDIARAAVAAWAGALAFARSGASAAPGLQPLPLPSGLQPLPAAPPPKRKRFGLF